MTDISGGKSRAERDAVVRAYNVAYQALCDAGMTLLSSDAVLLADFVKAGGAFHGPHIETATISVVRFVPFLRKLRADLDAAKAEIAALQKDIASSLRASMLATVDRVAAENALADEQARLDWVVHMRAKIRVQRGAEKWSVLDCRNELTFLANDHDTSRAAIDEARAKMAKEGANV